MTHDARETANCHQELLDSLPVREHIHWPIQEQSDMEGERRGQGEDCTPAERSLPRILSQSTPELGSRQRQNNPICILHWILHFLHERRVSADLQSAKLKKHCSKPVQDC